jgi:thermostable 8-oxoguanine DNA glycosylase
MQRVVLTLNSTSVTIELPAPGAEVVSGVAWGRVEDFPSPAYWVFQVLGRRLQGKSIRYRLGATLKEEVGACLLGGHGIRANVGIEAFESLRRYGAFSSQAPSEEQLLEWLSLPLMIEGREVHYRFARQKAHYLSVALKKLEMGVPTLTTGRELRNWLLSIPGIGPKTASWVVRNWLDADDVAILDIHLIRAGRICGFFDESLNVDRHYFQLEEQFIRFANGLGVRPSELDALIWYEMASSPSSVRKLLDSSIESLNRRAQNAQSNACQSVSLV